MSSKGVAATSPIQMLRRKTGFLIGFTVIIAVVLVGAWIFDGFLWKNNKNTEDELHSRTKSLDKTLQEEVDRLQAEIDELKEAVRKLSDCSTCEDKFVTRTTFDRTVEEVDEEFVLVYGNITLLQEEIDNITVTANCSACDGYFVSVTTFDQTIDQINQEIAGLEADEVLNKDSFAHAEGFIGPPDPNYYDYGPRAYWTMVSKIACFTDREEWKFQPVDLRWLTLEYILEAGTCPSTSDDLLRFDVDGGLMYCPCETGYYMMTLGVENVYVIRTAALTDPGDRPGFIYDAADRGGTIQFGLALKPQAGGHIPPFYEGDWPLAPVVSYAWDQWDQGTFLHPYNLSGIYENGMGFPITYNDTDVQFLPLSFTGSRPIILNATVNGEPACYKFVAQLYDPFSVPESLTGTACHDNPQKTVQVQYTFFRPPALNYTAGYRPMKSSLTLQRLAWTGEPPVYYG